MCALEGIKIIDISQAVAGPYVSMLLADMGAEVIAIERPGVGDVSRSWGPFVKGIGTYYLVCNRNKKSVTLDLRTKEGKEILFKLTKQSDIFIENFTPGTVKRLGIDYDKIREINPQIIYCQISGYGQDGPYSDRRVMDQIMQGEGGIMSFTGTPDVPCKVGVAITDFTAAMNAVYGILIALIYRERKGEGQRIDVSMFDGQVAYLSYQAQRYWLKGEIASRMGSEHPLIIPYQVFKTKDQKYINIAVINRETWRRFCESTNLGNLIDDPKFSTTDKRVENRKELTKIIDLVILQKNRKEWLDILTKAKVPCGSINEVDEVLNHPQTIHRKMVVELDHPVLGKIKLTGIPVKLSKSPGGIKTPPPLLGQHTEEVLKGQGFTEEMIRKLKDKGIV